MGTKTKPIKDYKNNAADLGNGEPEFDDWEAWDRIEAEAEAAKAAGARRYDPAIDGTSLVAPKPVRDPLDTGLLSGARKRTTNVGANQFGVCRDRAQTDRQRAYLVSLMDKLTDGEGERTVAAYEAAAGWNRKAASRAIDKAIQLVKQNTDPEADDRRANRYAGKCVRCGQWVEAEAGALVKTAAGWGVDHRKGPCPAPQPKAEAPKVELPDVADGYYAIESTGDNDLVFYRVSHSEKWGISVAMVVGGHTDQYVKRSHLKGILERLAVDPEAARLRYGRHIGRCQCCNLHLTDVVSRVSAIGPKCAAKHGVSRPSHDEAVALAAELGIDISEYQVEVA